MCYFSLVAFTSSQNIILSYTLGILIFSRSSFTGLLGVHQVVEESKVYAAGAALEEGAHFLERRLGDGLDLPRARHDLS